MTDFTIYSFALIKWISWPVLTTYLINYCVISNDGSFKKVKITIRKQPGCYWEAHNNIIEAAWTDSVLHDTVFLCLECNVGWQWGKSRQTSGLLKAWKMCHVLIRPSQNFLAFIPNGISGAEIRLHDTFHWQRLQTNLLKTEIASQEDKVFEMVEHKLEHKPEFYQTFFWLTWRRLHMICLHNRAYLEYVRMINGHGLLRCAMPIDSYPWTGSCHQIIRYFKSVSLRA